MGGGRARLKRGRREDRRERLCLRLIATMLGPGGKLDSAIRLAALLVATVAEGLAPYVDKVRRHAYEVTDADVSKLRSAGYTDDEIYELTVATAMGVGLNRFKVGLLWGMRPS